MHSQPCFNGLDIGGIQTERGCISNFLLDSFHDKFHQFRPPFSGGSQIDVDPVHTLFLLPLGLLGYGAWILLLKGIPNNRADDV